MKILTGSHQSRRPWELTVFLGRSREQPSIHCWEVTGRQEGKVPNKSPQNRRSRAWSSAEHGPACKDGQPRLPALSRTVPASEGCDNMYLKLCSAVVFCIFFFLLCYLFSNCFPGDSDSKEPAWQCRRRRRLGFEPWVRKIPWRREWQPTPVFLLGKCHGQKNLVGCRPWHYRVRHD